MWDSYLAEGEGGFREFHLYVCAAFLQKFSPTLLKMDFSEIMVFLQAFNTETWGDKEIEMLLSEAYMLKSLYHNSPAHLK